MNLPTPSERTLASILDKSAAWADVARLRRHAEQVEHLVKLGTFEADLATEDVTWSSGTYAIYGLTAGQPMTVARALTFYDAPTRMVIGQHYQAAREHGTPFDLTVPFRTASGEQGWARMMAQVDILGGSRRLFGVVRDVTYERDLEERLRQQANQDVLTGLPNRRAFEARLDEEAKHPDDRFGLCIIDVDRFKAVNDLHGHETGDALLQTVAGRLSGAVRATDFVARLGGDEFAVVLGAVAGKVDLLRRVSGIIEAAREPATCAGQRLTPSVSIGVALNEPRKAVEGLLRQADAALYRAKLDGRDRFRLFTPSLLRTSNDHERLIADVRSGLDRGQFEVHYQPIVDLRTRVVRGWEALVRWRHPTRGLLLPERFHGALTDPRTAVAIDDLVIETSLRQMRQWIDRGVPVTCAGVNVSEARLKRPDFVDSVMAALDTHRLTPDRLKIEIVETTLTGSAADQVAAAVDRLARLGVVSALDDFGTSQASLLHLRRFRVERIKIDRSFVADIETDQHDLAIVRCLIGLGRDLGIRITAKGVETPRQLAILRRLGCDVGQGFLFGRPMPPDDVPGFLERWYAQDAAALLDGDGASGPAALQIVA